MKGKYLGQILSDDFNLAISINTIEDFEKFIKSAKLNVIFEEVKQTDSCLSNGKEGK